MDQKEKQLLQDKIKVQGEVVRKLKEAKATKNEVIFVFVYFLGHTA